MKIGMVAGAVALGFGMSLTGVAEAKTSIAKGGRLCVAAAEAQNPNASSVRLEKEKTRAGSEILQFEIRVTGADGARQALVCVVDRATDSATVRPAQN